MAAACLVRGEGGDSCPAVRGRNMSTPAPLVGRDKGTGQTLSKPRAAWTCHSRDTFAAAAEKAPSALPSSSAGERRRAARQRCRERACWDDEAHGAIITRCANDRGRGHLPRREQRCLAGRQMQVRKGF